MDVPPRKYPRTFHFPESPGVGSDDKIVESLDGVLNIPLIFTEKMDGSNACLTRDDVFARSHSGPPTHASFDMLKSIHSIIRSDIPKGVEVYGEWLYAVHSIKYSTLPSYLMIFGARQGDVWLSWQDTSDLAIQIHASTVPVVCKQDPFQRGEVLSLCVKSALIGLASQPICGPTREGIVVRPLSEFRDDEFDRKVIKWVRKDHVQTDQHWRDKPIEKNGLGLK